MQDVILMIVAFALGFWQGLKKRNRKHQNMIKEYEMSISSLNDKIHKLQRRFRLEQYNNGSLKKKNKDRFETDLTSFITTSPFNYVLCANVYSILNMVFKVNYQVDKTYMEQEFIYDQVQTDIEDYFEKSEYQGDNVDLIVEYTKGRKKLINPYTAHDNYKSWIDQFNIEIYSITKKELLEVFHFILYEMDFEESL
jgi:hypothetical protein